MKKLLFLFSLMLVSCNSDEESRIFTVTTNAIPPQGGTVTLETTQETTGEYNFGDIANVKATPSAGYVFKNFHQMLKLMVMLLEGGKAVLKHPCSHP